VSTPEPWLGTTEVDDITTIDWDVPSNLFLTMHPTYSVVTGSDVEDGLEGQPDDAGGVHGEADELGLVEVLWTFPGLEGIEGAEDDEDAVVGERHQHA